MEIFMCFVYLQKVMTLRLAVEYLKLGKKIRLSSWDNDTMIESSAPNTANAISCITLIRGNFVSDNIHGLLSIEDALSDEWELVD